MPRIALPLAFLAVVMLTFAVCSTMPYEFYWYLRFVTVWGAWEMVREFYEAEKRDTFGTPFFFAFCLVVALVPVFGGLERGYYTALNIVQAGGFSLFGLVLWMHRYRPIQELPTHPDYEQNERRAIDEARELNLTPESSAWTPED